MTRLDALTVNAKLDHQMDRRDKPHLEDDRASRFAAIPTYHAEQTKELQRKRQEQNPRIGDEINALRPGERMEFLTAVLALAAEIAGSLRVRSRRSSMATPMSPTDRARVVIGARHHPALKIYCAKNGVQMKDVLDGLIPDDLAMRTGLTNASRATPRELARFQNAPIGAVEANFVLKPARHKWEDGESRTCGGSLPPKVRRSAAMIGGMEAIPFGGYGGLRAGVQMNDVLDALIAEYVATRS